MNSRRFRTPFSLMLLVVLSGLCGCSGKKDWHAETYSVTGSIQVNGMTPENAVLQLYSVSGEVDKRGSIPLAIVDGDGNFAFQTYSTHGMGCPAGSYALTLCWKVDFMDPNSPDRLKNKYCYKENPVMTVTIEPRRTVLDPIILTGEKLLAAK